MREQSPSTPFDAYADLTGLIGRWMEEYAQDRATTIFLLRRMLADLEAGQRARYEWRLARIEQVLELPAHPSFDLEDPEGDADG